MTVAISPDQLKSTLESLQTQLLDQRETGVHWQGELSDSALSTATAISALSFYLQAIRGESAGSDEQIQRIDRCCLKGIAWLLDNQNPDGGWGDTKLNYSNISTSMLVWAAFNASGQLSRCDDAMDHVKTYISTAGGVEAIKKRYGKDKTFAVPILANCAMAGIVDWKHVDAFPFEAACVPQKFYHLMQLPVVSYAIPALVAIGQVKHQFDPPRNPLINWLRKAARGRSLKVLRKMQPASGGYLEAIPLTSFVCMALIKCGLFDHPVVQNGIEFLLASFRDHSKDRGSWPIDTNLATWVTTLSVNALATDSEFDFGDNDGHSVLNWILDCQYKTVHPFTGAAPGGWGWSDLSGAVPDADDTPGALLALAHLKSRLTLCDRQQRELCDAARAGVLWLLNLQNRDSGWPTFCRGWGRFPFDRSGTDITAHVIRALLAWRDELDGAMANRCNVAIESGFGFLSNNQQNDGSWLPLWFGNQDQDDEINPFYGTAKVLFAYHEANRIHTNEAQLGLEWIRDNQNSDGGWGGGPSVSTHFDDLISSVEETALCTEALMLDSDPGSGNVAQSGVDWLRKATEKGQVSSVSPIGFYFAKLWYFEKLYPLIFATSAIARAKRKAVEPPAATET